MGMLDLLSGSMNRRSILITSAVGSAFVMTCSANILNLHSVAAQGATPEAGSAFDALDLPVLDVTINADGTLDMPAEFPAGTVKLRVNALEMGEWSTLFVQPPDGITEEDIKAALASPELPDFLHQSVVNGSLDILPDMETNAMVVQELVFDLGAGDWYVIQIAEQGSSYRMLTATGEPAVVDVPAAVEVEMSHHDFVVAEEVQAGKQIWKITNADAELHHMIIFSYPDPLTDEQALQALMAAEGMATPPAGVDPMQIAFVGASGLLSKDQASYAIFDLPPGNYFAACFISDPGVDVPHVVNGMIQVFTAV